MKMPKVPLLIRLSLALIVIAAVSLPATLPAALPTAVLADDDDDDDDGNAGEDRDDDDRDDDHNKKKDKGKGKGKDKDKNKDKDDDEVIVVAPNVTPLAIATVAPTPTVAAQSVGMLRVVARECATTPAADADWQSVCTGPSIDAAFELKALDGPLAEWYRELIVDATGTVTLERLPAARYALDQLGNDWCRAESDRVDANGDVVIAPGKMTTVWAFNCPAPHLGS